MMAGIEDVIPLSADSETEKIVASVSFLSSLKQICLISCHSLFLNTLLFVCTKKTLQVQQCNYYNLVVTASCTDYSSMGLSHTSCDRLEYLQFVSFLLPYLKFQFQVAEPGILLSPLAGGKMNKKV